MLVVKDARFRGDRVEFTEHTVCSVDDFVLWVSSASTVLDRFAGHLVARYIPDLYDLDREIVAPRYDSSGAPVITGAGFQTRRLSIRQLFAEGGIHV